MLDEHIELALRSADVQLFEIPLNRDVKARERAPLAGLDVAPEDQERVARELEAFAHEPRSQLVIEYRAPDGSNGQVRWRQARGSLVRNEHGLATYLVGATQDITQSRESQQAELRAINVKLELAMQLFDFRVIEIDLRGTAASAHAGGSGSESWDGRGLRSMPLASYLEFLERVVIPEDLPRVLELFERIVGADIPEGSMECRMRNPNGDGFRWRFGRCKVYLDESGVPERCLSFSHDITHIKTAEEEAQRVKDRLELALRVSNAATWDLETPDGLITSGIPVFTNAWEQCGYEAPSDPYLAAQVLSVLLPPGEAERFMAGVQAFFDGTACEFETEQRVLHKDGTERWHLKRGVVARNESGRVTRFTGTSIDITERKQMERALLKSEERFRTTFANAAVGMIVTDADGTFLEYNRRFCGFLGYSAEELAGRCVFEFMDPGEAVLHLENQRSVVRGEAPAFTRDTRYFRKDGAVVWGNLTLSVIQRHADGTPVHVMGILQEITERKALEAEIRQGRETLELAMRGSDISVAVVDVPDGDLNDSRWTVFNFWEPTGLDPATVPANFEGWTRLSIHPDDYDAVLANFRAAAESRRPDWYIEHRFFHADGSVRWRLSRGTILYDDAGKVMRILATAIDITKLKQIESELSRAREAAEAANRAKDEFLANVSHEIRTPMNAILGMTELALDSTPNEHQRQLLSTVRSAAKALLGVINDLLDFSKIAAGKLTLDSATFSLRAAVGDTLRALAVRAHRKGLELLCHVRPEVPDALDGDVGRLRQVLMNLVGNAVKFTQRGEIEVDVEVGPSPGGSRATDDVQLVFTVRDTGIGIAPETQSTIFQAFEQGDSSTTRKYGGTGLGLTIAAELAALMSGSITVESVPGHGSKFRFTARFARSMRSEGAATSPERLGALPALIVDDNETNRRILEEWLTSWRMQPTAVGSALAARPERLSALDILVGEDNDLNVAVLEELLRRHGHHARFARDGRAALDLAIGLTREDACDLMLLDLHMPGLDGFQVARAIREHEQGADRHLPIIALTARSSAHDRERCIAAGMDEFLSKPIEAAALWAAVERVVRQRSPGRGVSARSKSELLDPRAILRHCAGQASLLEKIRVLFRKSLPNQMAWVRTALGAGDFVSLREAAHRLGGTAGELSTVTAEVALTLEDQAICQDLESCAALVERLGAMCDALLEETATLSIDWLNRECAPPG